MNLYIETENGVTKNHPAFENNLMQAFGAVPAHWEPFTRVERPTPSVYQTMDSNEPVYAKVDGVWTDVWTVRELTTEEKTAKQQAVITAFNSRDQASNWSAWILDEATNTMVPPIPRPDPVEGKLVFWCGADANWKDVPARPEGEYKFDFFAWNWVAL
tara:strand:+ start:22 stop:495 length:474 start_codon:yes stop_codon:yes gene_type:complete